MELIELIFSADYAAKLEAHYTKEGHVDGDLMPAEIIPIIDLITIPLDPNWAAADLIARIVDITREFIVLDMLGWFKWSHRYLIDNICREMRLTEFEVQNSLILYHRLMANIGLFLSYATLVHSSDNRPQKIEQPSFQPAIIKQIAGGLLMTFVYNHVECWQLLKPSVQHAMFAIYQRASLEHEQVSPSAAAPAPKSTLIERYHSYILVHNMLRQIEPAPHAGFFIFLAALFGIKLTDDPRSSTRLILEAAASASLSKLEEAELLLQEFLKQRKR